eukprot:1244981-Lingulodinium_polyedra.AAC.1
MFKGEQPNLKVGLWLSKTVYHGAYPECFTRATYCGFMESNGDDGPGHDCRTGYSAVFTAETMDHAM